MLNIVTLHNSYLLYLRTGLDLDNFSLLYYLFPLYYILTGKSNFCDQFLTHVFQICFKTKQKQRRI